MGNNFELTTNIMILSFKPQFVEKILSGSKIHTIREDKNKRWSIGKKIHSATGVRTKQYNCFHEGQCKGLQEFSIYWRGNNIYPVAVYISRRELNLDETERLAKNDGFDTVDDFYKWFNKDFKGIIIHWTDFIYT